MNLYYNDAYTCNNHAFDTTRKSQWIAESLASHPINGVEIKSPSYASWDKLTLAHSAEYISAVCYGEPLKLAESSGLRWDSAMWVAVTAQTGGVIAAALDAMAHGVSGSLSSGLHHARYNRGAGFCTFNGLVIAARVAQESGARSVLILDLDAHCGGGTDSLIAGDRTIWHLDIAVDGYDMHKVDDHSRLEIVTDAKQYLPVLRSCLSDLADSAPCFDLCLYNAGMDPHRDCETGGLFGITTEVLKTREKIVFDWCRQYNIPVAVVLAGGYTGNFLSREKLVSLHRLTIEAAAFVDIA